MKKVLIQVVSVITLVFGTCYQSVLALADDRERTELSGVQLSDSQGNRPNLVHFHAKPPLDLTIPLLLSFSATQTAAVTMWLPAPQFLVLHRLLKADSAVPDT